MKRKLVCDESRVEPPRSEKQRRQESRLSSFQPQLCEFKSTTVPALGLLFNHPQLLSRASSCGSLFLATI